MKRSDFTTKFIKEMLPRNYALTKSMELTKIESSGTLWYMKKYIVLYNSIFLDEDISTNRYINKCIKYFDVFINSLDPKVKDKAKDFFYPKENKINMKSDDFVSFQSFLDQIEYEDIDMKNQEIEQAKKYYFAFLLQFGGQSKVKKKIKDEMFSESFKFSINNVKEIIRNYNHRLSEKRVTQIFNDYHAALRNERQILFYYGYFHGKSTGASKREFSSLTPIGELSLIANYQEFLCIWEMQKLKMISQTVLTNIDKVSSVNRKMKINSEAFGISYNPYLDILDFLYKYNEINQDVYQYIISRNRSVYLNDVLDNSESLIKNIAKIEKRIKKFKTNDEKKDDFDKELKKYLLGLRSDLSRDQGTNPLGCVKIMARDRRIVVTDKEKFKKIYMAYKITTNYKRYLYINIYDNFEKEIKRQYISRVNNNIYKRDERLKLIWDMYNIKSDNNLLLYIMIVYISITNNIVIERSKCDDFTHSVKIYFNDIINRLGLDSGLNKKVIDVMVAFNNRDFDRLNIVQEELVDLTSIRKDIPAEDLLRKIKEDSKLPSEYKYGNRVRKKALISNIKSYYETKYSDINTGLVKCECCGEETFMTYNNEPYLEFHHLIPFSEEGPDHYLNIFAICPNCHRKIHYLNINNRKEYYEKLNNNNHFKQKFVERLIELKNERILKSYQLEYLLINQAISDVEFDRIVEQV